MEKTISRIEIRSFLISSFLMGCRLTTKKKWLWTDTRLDWIEWKAKYVRRAFGYPCIVTPSTTCENNTDCHYQFLSNAKKGRLRVYGKWFSNVKGEPKITTKIQHLNHPIAFTIFLIDAGKFHGELIEDAQTKTKYYRDPSVSIDFSKFSIGELKLLQEAIKNNFELSTDIKILVGNTASDDQKELHFDTAQTQRLIELIRPTIPNLVYVKTKLSPLIFQTTNVN